MGKIQKKSFYHDIKEGGSGGSVLHDSVYFFIFEIGACVSDGNQFFDIHCYLGQTRKKRKKLAQIYL